MHAFCISICSVQLFCLYFSALQPSIPKGDNDIEHPEDCKDDKDVDEEEDATE